MLTTQVLIGINAAVWLLITATGGSSSVWVDRFALLPKGICGARSLGGFYPNADQAQCATLATGHWVPGVADGAYWQQHPFREPEPGYLTRVFAEEESARCEFGTPIVDGDRAVVEWSAETKLTDGGSEELIGVSLLRFDQDGLVVEQRDIWVGR